MTAHTYVFQGKLQKFPEAGSWKYIVVPRALALELRQRYRPNHGGWSSLRVRATVGASTWLTSIFWIQRGGYYLFIKAAIRKIENLRLGKSVRATVTLLNV